MNQTSGAFNYSGLVANMEMKAGMFYGALYSQVPGLTELTRDTKICSSGISCFMGVACGEY